MNEQIADLLERLNLVCADRRKREEIIGELVSLLANELRQRASRLMSHESYTYNLQTTALFHETYIRLVGSNLTFADRQLFLSMSSRIMRQILVDEARSRTRLRNNKGNLTALDFDTAERAAAVDPEVLIDLESAVDKLPEQDAQLVNLVFYYGMTLEEAGMALEVRYETLRKRWSSVRRRLYTSLQGQV